MSMRHKAKFQEFHRNHPEVYAKLVSMARVMKARGYRKIGIANFFEVMRWEWRMERDATEEFKLNNNYKAWYSRLIEEQNPDLKDFFTKRVSYADD